MDKWHLFFPIYEVAMSITVQELLVVPNVNWEPISADPGQVSCFWTTTNLDEFARNLTDANQCILVNFCELLKHYRSSTET